MINAGTSRSGYTSSGNCEGDTVTTPSRGQGGIGYVGYQSKPFWLGPLCYKMQSINKDVLVNKYLFYFLQSRSQLLLALKKEGGVPAVNKSDLAKVMIPIPPSLPNKSASSLFSINSTP
jgi:type I restriction enzyme S subunit